MANPSAPPVAAIPLLETKLYLPRWRPGLVSRPRLVEQLDQGRSRKLTLLSAPPGFGKTTLLAEWLAPTPARGHGRERPAAWLSLDRTDNDPTLFWTYLITALRQIAPRVGETALSMLRAPQPPPIEPILTTLINELAAIPDPFALILDDLHLIDAPPIHAALAFLLDHLPPPMHLVVASRSDPPFPLPRLRSRGESTELRAADLRFTPDEAAAFLTGAMGLNLSANDVATLEARTEGWIAGLQLAALSLQRRDDVPDFIKSFAGDDRHVVEFLVSEVLERQPAPVRTFLLQTSLLDRLSGPLCDAVTGRADGTDTLASLERANLFVVPLDDKRRWYRYHHLFADVLQAHALAEQPAQIPARHRRASAWYEANGLRPDAIRHALAAADFARAADLVELAALPMLGSSREETLRGWLTALPDDAVRARPVLSVYFAYASFAHAGLEAAAARLRDAEHWLDPGAPVGDPPAAPSGPMVVVDDAAFRALPGTIAVARAYLAGAVEDLPGMVASARRALDLLPEDDDLWRGAAAALLGIGAWTSGDLDAAFRSYSEGRTRLQRAGITQFQIVGVYILADIRIAQGRLRDAERIYRQSLRLATEQGDPVWGTADLHVGLSELHFERDEPDAAADRLRQSRALGEHAGLHDTRHRWYVAMARLTEAQGDLAGALDLLAEAERQFVPSADPDLRPIAAQRARLWVAHGQLAAAAAWVRDRNLSIHDDLSYRREFDHITLARILIDRSAPAPDGHSPTEAIGLLDRLLHAAVAGARTGSVIEILILLARAHAARGDLPQAIPPLERALALAEPENYVRLFVAEGAPIRTLLRHLAAGGPAPDYTRRLLAAFDRPPRPAPTHVPAPTHPAPTALTDPLTKRELEILRLIAAGMRNQDIADHLFISLSTVKRHIANTYGKLGVGHRTAATARATELNLL